MKRHALVLTLSCVAFACAEKTETVDYDTSWGEQQFIPTGKADLLDVTPPVELGGSVDGEVDETSLDLYKIDLTRGDEFTLTKTVTSGDLAPDASLFFATGGSISSDDFSVSPSRLTKDYTAPSTDTFLIAVRAFRNQGSGEYQLEVNCTGGPCDGDPIPVDPDEVLTNRDMSDCLLKSWTCALEDLERFNGAVGDVRASAALDGCLARSEESGRSCAPTCENEDFGGLCDIMVEELQFFVDQESTCRETLDTCLDVCTDGGGFSSHPFGAAAWICFDTGFNGNCVSHARALDVCGGPVSDPTAVCVDECHSTNGAWTDDTQDLCDHCGRCGLVCGSQLGWIEIPEEGLVGRWNDDFVGEVDPFEVGDACIVFVDVPEGIETELPPGRYGLVESMSSTCLANQGWADWRRDIHVPTRALEEITDSPRLDALHRLEEVRYFELLDSDVVRSLL